MRAHEEGYSCRCFLYDVGSNRLFQKWRRSLISFASLLRRLSYVQDRSAADRVCRDAHPCVRQGSCHRERAGQCCVLTAAVWLTRMLLLHCQVPAVPTCCVLVAPKLFSPARSLLVSCPPCRAGRVSRQGGLFNARTAEPGTAAGDPRSCIRSVPRPPGQGASLLTLCPPVPAALPPKNSIIFVSGFRAARVMIVEPGFFVRPPPPQYCLAGAGRAPSAFQLQNHEQGGQYDQGARLQRCHQIL